MAVRTLYNPTALDAYLERTLRGWMQSKVAARMASAVTGQSVCAIANPRYYKPLPITSLDTEKYPRAAECAAFDYARLRSRHPHAPRYQAARRWQQRALAPPPI